MKKNPTEGWLWHMYYTGLIDERAYKRLYAMINSNDKDLVSIGFSIMSQIYFPPKKEQNENK